MSQDHLIHALACRYLDLWDRHVIGLQTEAPGIGELPGGSRDACVAAMEAFAERIAQLTNELGNEGE